MIKKILAFLPCHVFWYLGDWTANVLNIIPNNPSPSWEFVTSILYRCYSGFMLISVWWNDYGGLKVWEQQGEVDSFI